MDIPSTIESIKELEQKLKTAKEGLEIKIRDAYPLMYIVGMPLGLGFHPVAYCSTYEKANQIKEEKHAKGTCTVMIYVDESKLYTYDVLSQIQMQNPKEQ
jgi:hypothetical protein